VIVSRPATGAVVRQNRPNPDPQRFQIHSRPRHFVRVKARLVLGPSQFLWDFSTLKNFSITENHRLQFRFEAFNFVNHPVLGNFGAAWGNNPNGPIPDFGRIRNTAVSMRQLQFGLKYLF
jgi:hypothetical protein